METTKIEKVIKNLTDVFFKAGAVSIELRKNGLTEHLKNDKTPVTNGDIEVNNIILENLKKITRIYQLFPKKLRKIKTLT